MLHPQSTAQSSITIPPWAFTATLYITLNIPSIKIVFHLSALDNWNILSSKPSSYAFFFVVLSPFSSVWINYFHLHSCTFYIQLKQLSCFLPYLRDIWKWLWSPPRSYKSLEDKVLVQFIFEFVVQWTKCTLLDWTVLKNFQSLTVSFLSVI